MTPENREILYRVAQWTIDTKRKAVKTIRELAQTEENYLLIIREIDRVDAHLSRARTFRTEATLTLIDWLTTLDYFDWHCAYCGTKPFQVLNHFVPLPLGGTTPDNCVPSCYACVRPQRRENARVLAYLSEVKSRLHNAALNPPG